MGRLGRGLFSCLELRGGSPHLCWLRTNRLAPVSKFELCTGTYGIFWGPESILASSVAELNDTLPYLMDDRRDNAWATHGVSAEANMWKSYSRVRWARLDSLIVIVKYCHSWCPPGSHVSCCQVISLARCKIDLRLHDYPRT
jgi:hypothetical protein